MTTADIVAKFKDLTKDLLYPSETDSPFKVIAAEEVPYEDFFADLTLDKQNGQRYAELEDMLDNLSHVRILRIGTTRVSIYIIGKAETGDWIVLQTLAVET